MPFAQSMSNWCRIRYSQFHVDISNGFGVIAKIRERGQILPPPPSRARVNPRTCRGGVERTPHGFSWITRLKRIGSQQTFQYPRIDQFDTYPENFDPLRWTVTELWRHMSGQSQTKSADFAIYRIWASFVAFWSLLLHSRQHHWCLWISRSHIQLPRGQGHARSRVPWSVSVAHFSRYNSKFTAALSLRVIV